MLISVYLILVILHTNKMTAIANTSIGETEQSVPNRCCFLVLETENEEVLGPLQAVNV